MSAYFEEEANLGEIPKLPTCSAFWPYSLQYILHDPQCCEYTTAPKIVVSHSLDVDPSDPSDTIASAI